MTGLTNPILEVVTVREALFVHTTGAKTNATILPAVLTQTRLVSKADIDQFVLLTIHATLLRSAASPAQSVAIFTAVDNEPKLPTLSTLGMETLLITGRAQSAPVRKPFGYPSLLATAGTTLGTLFPGADLTTPPLGLATPANR